ncbi:MAG: sensor histidine kinase [Thermodesulfobacteriota bacterium]
MAVKDCEAEWWSMADPQGKNAVDGWEQACLRQAHDAAVGRLFRGLIHNLNGALQVFSLQTDLFVMTSEQATALARQLLAAKLAPETRTLAQQLVDLLLRREDAVRQMQEKARDCEQVVQRTLLLPDFAQTLGTDPYTVNSVIRTEVEFLCADSFFKHKVAKDLFLAAEQPPLAEGQLALHQVLFSLLENSVIAVRDSEQPRVVVRSSHAAGITTVVVEDNGPGVPEADRERVFEPFYSTWTDHLGLGLYLARKLAAELRGTLVCDSSPEGAAFRLTLPVA